MMTANNVSGEVQFTSAGVIADRREAEPFHFLVLSTPEEAGGQKSSYFESQTVPSLNLARALWELVAK